VSQENFVMDISLDVGNLGGGDWQPGGISLSRA
jgi:hypothetical protein